MPHYVPEETRRELMATPVTLDGRRAVISGVCRDFATVTALPDGPGYEYSWNAVELVVKRGGAFRS